MNESNGTDKEASETEKKERMTRAQITAAAAEKMGRAYQAVRRELEPVWAADTQRKIHEAAAWVDEVRRGVQGEFARSE